MNAQQFLKGIGPVHHWYQHDESDPRDNADILSDIVADLLDDRNACLDVQRIAQDAQRACRDGAPISAFNLAQQILTAVGVGLSGEVSPARMIQEEGRSDA